jgi:hypothetical protein
MSSNAQVQIREYITSRFFLDGIRIEDIGADQVRITDREADTMTLTCNLYGDILEVLPDGGRKLLAESNSEHNLFMIGSNKMPTRWTDKPYIKGK